MGTVSAKPATKKRTQRSYNEREIELALSTVAFLNGNTRQAHKELKQAGLSINPATLWRWSRKKYVEKYEEIRREVTPRAREWAAERHMALADEHMEINRSLLERLRGTVEDIPARDLPGAVRNVSTAAAIETDKAQLLAGQPTVRVERSVSEIVAKLKARTGWDLEVEAEEVAAPELTGTSS